MANATTIVLKGAVRRADEFIEQSSATLTAATTFWPHAMVGRTAGGYLAKMDDTQALIFFGLVTQDQGKVVLPIGTAGDQPLFLRAHQPFRFELAITSVAVTDINKPVYAIDDQTGTLDPSTRTSANLIGHVAGLVYKNDGTVQTNQALVEPAYDGVAAHARLGASLFLAATGTITLTKLDLNKFIFIQGTAAQTINLPAVAGCPAGSRLTFLKTTSNAVAATLDGNAAENIDGAATLATIDAQFDTATLVSDGTQWIVVARDIT